MKAAIVIDSWKLPIFKKHLTQANFIYTQSPGLTANTLTLTVKTARELTLADIVRSANAEAAHNGPG